MSAPTDRPSTVVLINPNVILQRHDVFTTGIVYMPVGLAYFAAQVRSRGWDPHVIDAFGEAPNQYWERGNFVFRGITPVEVAARVAPVIRDACLVVVYAINLTYHEAVIDIIRELRRAHPAAKIAVLENTQAVTAYSIAEVQEDFYSAGADFVIAGEGEERGIDLLVALAQGASHEEIARIDGIGFPRGRSVHFTRPARTIANLDEIPFAAWDLFPVKNYWKLPYAHGPKYEAKYLSILTSRGCPYACRFCVIPATNSLKWRAASAKRVVDEIEHLQRAFGVREFHVEDVDPTVSDKRTRAICEEIMRRKLDVSWKLVAGTKVETLRSSETIGKMAAAGCTYISISPESGSARVMKLINKPFDVQHAVDLIHAMNRFGIRSQACFVLGFPGEEDADRLASLDLVKKLTRNGLDEVAIFIVTPVPGSAIFAELSGYRSYSELNFSPSWRPDYEELNRFRLKMYRTFLLLKVRHFPRKIVKQIGLFALGKFQTKMEMVPFRALHTFLLLRGWIGRRVHYPPEPQDG